MGKWEWIGNEIKYLEENNETSGTGLKSQEMRLKYENGKEKKVKSQHTPTDLLAVMFQHHWRFHDVFLVYGSYVHSSILRGKQTRSTILSPLWGGCIKTSKYEYCIVGNFRGGNLLRIGEKYDLCRENFHGLFPLPHQRTPHSQILQRKLLQKVTKLQQSQTFSLSKVSHYTAYSSYVPVSWTVWGRLEVPPVTPAWRPAQTRPSPAAGWCSVYLSWQQLPRPVCGEEGREGGREG